MAPVAGVPASCAGFVASRPAPSRGFGGGVAWGPWLMDLRRDWLGGSAKHLRWSSTVFGLAQTVDSSRLVAFPDDLSFSGPEGAC